MRWEEVFAVFVVCHLTGDFLLQTDWQARHKQGGLSGDPVARRALAAHILTYTLAFVPALVWLSDDLGASALLAAVAVSVPHYVQDDGRLVNLYLARVKHCDPVEEPMVAAAVDQTLHLLALFALALVVGS